jgi:hypothetical protein
MMETCPLNTVLAYPLTFCTASDSSIRQLFLVKSFHHNEYDMFGVSGVRQKTHKDETDSGIKFRQELVLVA